MAIDDSKDAMDNFVEYIFKFCNFDSFFWG